MSQIYNPKIHHRQSVRLKDFDYSQDGYYFVTICTKNKIERFGQIIDGEMILNKYGEIVVSEWENTKNIRKNVQLDKSIVMPNHLHGIVIIENRRDELHSSSSNMSPIQDNNMQNQGVYQYAPTIKFKSPTNNLGAIIRGFKSAGTKQINQQNPSLSFKWQSGFYDRIIRGEEALDKIREYIENNPMKWELDKNNVENIFM